MLLFHKADVWQDRNEHNIMKDFTDEVVGYTKNNEIIDTLSALKLKDGKQHVYDNLRICYEALISIGIMEQRELGLVEAWIADCKEVMPALSL